MKTEVLDHDQILRICNRFAFQILENSNDFDDIHLIGIKEKGFEVAKIIENELKLISNKNICLNSIKINKKNPKDPVSSDINLKTKYKFKHDAIFKIGNFYLVGCYHPSPRNVNTKRINQPKMVRLFLKAQKLMKHNLSK